jgi:hypothetical protein
MSLGLCSKEEWDECLAEGNVHHGPYLPNNPDEMYQTEWISWDDFLGVIHPYEETRQIIVKTVLK